MALNPVPALTFTVLWATFVALVTAAAVPDSSIPDCSGWNILSGCDSLISRVLSIGVLGTIASAPTAVNVILGVIGLACRATVIWSVAELVRGT